MHKRLSVTFVVNRDGLDSIYEVQGQIARTLTALVDAGDEGQTAQEVSSWAFRFGAYIHELRHRYGLEIQTIREEHPFGWHGRYVLQTPVRIVRIETVSVPKAA